MTVQRLSFPSRGLAVIGSAVVVCVPLLVVGRAAARLEAAIVPLVIISALCWVDSGATWLLDPLCVQRRAWTRTVSALCAATAASVVLVTWFSVARGELLHVQWAAAGIALGACGIWARAAAIQQLGPFFVSEVQWAAGQNLVRTGPYRYCPHPGDWGLCVALAGCALASGTLAALGAWALTLLPLTIVRSALETRFLASVAPHPDHP